MQTVDNLNDFEMKETKTRGIDEAEPKKRETLQKKEESEQLEIKKEKLSRRWSGEAQKLKSEGQEKQEWTKGVEKESELSLDKKKQQNGAKRIKPGDVFSTNNHKPFPVWRFSKSWGYPKIINS